MNIGKRKRLQRILGQDGRAVTVPMDHGVTEGPIKGLVNMESTITKAVLGGADAVIVHKGIAKTFDTGKTGLIIHLTGSTKHCRDPNYKIQFCTVEEALRLGADAVSVHVNVGSRRETTMLKKMGQIAEECEKLGVPLLAMMYPRGKDVKDEHSPELIAHASRLGAEIGADIIKTNYTGDPETFRAVVEGCPVPVIIAGGPKVKTAQEVLRVVYDSLQVGGAGVSIGRNVFQHSDPTSMVKALSTIVHRGSSVEDGLRILGVKR
jgi:fructose-bisphosphate aldolase/2-amino-3,7-dideoxy-D-threo-hept-6-ulosonate synthase